MLATATFVCYIKTIFHRTFSSHFINQIIFHTLYTVQSPEHTTSYIRKDEKKRKTRERSKSQHASKKSRNFLHGKIQSPEISATNEIHVQVKRHSLSKLEAPKPLMLPDAWNPSSISLFWSIP